MSHAESDAWRPEVAGWSTDILPFYDAVARELAPGATIVEVGVYRGRSLLFLAERLVARFGTDNELQMRAGTLYGVDPLGWDHGELARHTHRSWTLMDDAVATSARLLTCTSEMAAKMFPDGSLDLVFIDGDHEYESVKADLQTWLPKVKPGGMISGHDYGGGHPGVPRAVDEVIGKLTGKEGTVWWKGIG
jgi:predicted O-methyltransferase YrrM